MGDFIQPPPNMQPVAIYEDGGGLVSKYQAMAQQYRLEGRKVKIMGSCRSACVLALSVPTTCVSPGAVVKAHYAYEQDTGIIRKDITTSMMNDLPEKIRNRLEPNLSKSYNYKTTLSYRDLVSLGVPSCDGSKPKEPITVVSHRVKSTRIVAQSPSNPLSQFVGFVRRSINGTP